MDALFEKIKEARERLKNTVHRTPVLTSGSLNKIFGAEIFFKCENFQRAGAFKFRGAYNAVVQLTDYEKSKGIITYSSGNHAQAIALVGKLLNINTTVVMPVNAPKTKRAAAEAYGAKVIDYDSKTEIREEVAQALIAKNGYTLIPPFDHLNIVCGQGTVALEFFEEAKNLDILLVPCGGGGLLSGSAISAKNIYPKCKVIGVEPELADDATKSFNTKVLHTVKNPLTIADGTRTASLGQITFPLVLKYVDEMTTVSEENIIEAVKLILFRLKIIVEPSGALGLAALLSRKQNLSGRIGIILSGGNIDAETLISILDHNTSN
jgi:threonine dehydratase